MGIKISELQEKTTANDTDIIPIVDTGTKKITKANLLKEITEALANLGTYSTEETYTGKKWIDGKKIYRKVVAVDFPTESLAVVETKHNITNIDTVTDQALTWYDTYDKRWYKTFKDTSGQYYVQIDGIANEAVRVKTSAAYRWDARTSNRYAILEYTKTTD